MNILLCTDQNYYLYTYVLTVSILHNHPSNKVVIYIAYDKLADQEIDKYRKLFNQKNHRVVFIRDTDHLLDNIPEFKLNRLPKSTFLRLAAIQYLPEKVNKILYLDADIIVKHSLVDFYSTNLNGYLAAACPDKWVALNYPRLYKKLNLKSKYDYFNAGVMLLNLKFIREMKLLKWDVLIEFISSNLNDFTFNDQCVINMLFHDKVYFMEAKKYNFIWNAYKKDENIFRYLFDRNVWVVHYAGNKPWRKKEIDILSLPFWKYTVMSKELINVIGKMNLMKK